MAELEQESGEGKKSPKTLIIMIVAAVILLAAGGGVTFFLMKGDSSNGEKVEHGGEDEAAVHVEKLYFDMSKPVVVDFPKGSTVKHGRITVSMLVEGAETIEVLKKNEPMIRNNLLMLIGAQDPASLNSREGKEMLGKAMLDDVTAVLVKMAGKGQVKQIFFTSFVMQ
ncbi:MAG: flagellar basal body-associated FliL family protein [Methylobacter sp.]|uniref:flagellar basal body-associated FliL family protein n=1 Tax=Methylobacter sp. TaxID=2051955 RepID=UPI002730F462|nr:flagellar basal body-associated FliL family protein [Methylobacter sp.]MDP1665480.1 flagellar basal body-associated FliL family protein [Methylobacter sp.]